MAPNKCSYITLSNSNRPIILNIKLYGESIQLQQHPKFLGITLDRKMRFVKHIKDIKRACIDRLNILKILSQRSWKLSETTLLNIYKVLIRSLTDYSSILSIRLLDSNVKNLQIIQNKALRIIYKLPYDANVDTLQTEINLPKIKDRLFVLTSSYLANSLANRNELIVELFKEYWKKFSTKTLKYPTFFCDAKDIYKEILDDKELDEVEVVDVFEE